MRRLIGIAVLVLVVAPSPLSAASSDAAASKLLTGKERLSGKAADEQRVNDCKVPSDRRGATWRPSACGRKAVQAGQAPPQPPTPE